MSAAKTMLGNWCWVFLGNLIGSVVYGGAAGDRTDQFRRHGAGRRRRQDHRHRGGQDDRLRGARLCRLVTVFVKAILCNWMVCLGIVAAMTTTSTIGKIACAYMPIFIFFAQGFEHSVVNMFIIPTGMMMGAKVTVARMVAVEPDSGDARQSGRRLRLHRARALHHP